MLLALQLIALIVLAVRLLPGRKRHPAVPPASDSPRATRVSVVVPARNEVERIQPCIDGLAAQGTTLSEVIIVDGGSTDGTREMVVDASTRDRRFRLLDEPPRPRDSVGRPWAIAAGCRAATSEWILVVDADTAPNRGMVAGALAAAEGFRLDVVSFAPRIVARSTGARMLQPAFLTTLVYRFGVPGTTDVNAERAMANGQCLLLRRQVLESHGGYEIASRSYCDDISIVRHLAGRGARVGFLDGRELFDVTMYPTGTETWNGWPRSLNMQDATSNSWRALDALFLLLTQALPLPVVAAVILAKVISGALAAPTVALLGVNLVLLLVRVLVAIATARSFRTRGLAYWLAPLADLPVVLRVIEQSFRPTREWRGGMRPGIAGAGSA